MRLIKPFYYIGRKQGFGNPPTAKTSFLCEIVTTFLLDIQRFWGYD